MSDDMKSLNDEKRELRLSLAKHFTVLEGFIELDLTQQLQVIDTYYNYVYKGTVIK